MICARGRRGGGWALHHRLQHRYALGRDLNIVEADAAKSFGEDAECRVVEGEPGQIEAVAQGGGEQAEACASRSAHEATAQSQQAGSPQVAASKPSRSR